MTPRRSRRRSRCLLFPSDNLGCSCRLDCVRPPVSLPPAQRLCCHFGHRASRRRCYCRQSRNLPREVLRFPRGSPAVDLWFSPPRQYWRLGWSGNSLPAGQTIPKELLALSAARLTRLLFSLYPLRDNSSWIFAPLNLNDGSLLNMQVGQGIEHQIDFRDSRRLRRNRVNPMVLSRPIDRLQRMEFARLESSPCQA